MQLESCFPEGFSACFVILFVWSLLSLVAANNFGTRRALCQFGFSSKDLAFTVEGTHEMMMMVSCIFRV
jgi:hypothetical protein